MPNTTALAMAPHKSNAGTASALLGLLQMLFGACVVPLVSAAGATALSMSATMFACSGCSLLFFLYIGRRDRR
jgi:DHA1 family bicyclomycin/chloramphenicol resistance-like MFS transporter